MSISVWQNRKLSIIWKTQTFPDYREFLAITVTKKGLKICEIEFLTLKMCILICKIQIRCQFLLVVTGKLRWFGKSCFLRIDIRYCGRVLLWHAPMGFTQRSAFGASLRPTLLAIGIVPPKASHWFGKIHQLYLFCGRKWQTLELTTNRRA